jgi:hypothetical protein
MLIKGEDLTEEQVKMVKAAFVYRYLSILSDDEWIKQHAFHFLKDGTRLSFKHKFAEPHYMAEETPIECLRTYCLIDGCYCGGAKAKKKE